MNSLETYKGYYRHYKGGIYKFITIAIDVESKKDKIIYQNSRGTIYARDIDDFNSPTDTGTIRFEPLGTIPEITSIPLLKELLKLGNITFHYFNNDEQIVTTTGYHINSISESINKDNDILEYFDITKNSINKILYDNIVIHNDHYNII